MAPSATNGSNGTSNGASKLDFTTFQNVVNGHLVSTSSTRHGINPATKKPNPPVPVATPKDLDEAVAAAKEAFKTWSRTSVPERREKLVAYAQALQEHADDFAKLLTTEQGKPLMFASAEVTSGVHWLTEMAKLDLPDEVVEDNEERKVITRYTPLGVVAAIVPWNFPIQLGTSLPLCKYELG
jgi:acyl-CoA reductase-like NAD-dependent aldehyde dehydrogenase